MAARSGNRPQVGSAELLNDFLRALDVRGELGELDVRDFVVPVVQLAAIRESGDPVEVRNQVGAVGYYRRSSVAAAVRTIVAATTNVNGVLVAHGYVQAQSGTSQNLALMAKSSVPASATDATANHLLHVEQGTVSAPVWSCPFPLLLPAGVGLYEGNSALAQTMVAVGYTVL